MALFPISTMSAADTESFSDVCIAIAVIGGALLIVGLIGEYFESEWWKKSAWYKLAKMAVIIGVLGELLADTAIFKASEREQQITNQSIESNLAAQRAMLEQLKPRDITRKQIDAIASVIRGKIGTIYLYPLEEIEASQYAFAVSEALKAGGVNVQLMLSTTSGVPAFPDKFNAAVSITGVTAWESGGNHETVDLLMRAFLLAGITIGGEYSDAMAGIVDGKWVADAGVKSPAIFVGLKPVPFSRFPLFATTPEMEQYFKDHPPPWEPK
jgi:hypothetical protein